MCNADCKQERYEIDEDYLNEDPLFLRNARRTETTSDILMISVQPAVKGAKIEGKNVVFRCFQQLRSYRDKTALHNAAHLYSDLATPLWVSAEVRTCKLTLGNRASYLLGHGESPAKVNEFGKFSKLSVKYALVFFYYIP